jgi:hypothetical protein
VEFFRIAVKERFEERVLGESVVEALDAEDAVVFRLKRFHLQAQPELRHLAHPDVLRAGVVVGEAGAGEDGKGAHEALLADTGLVTNVADRQRVEADHGGVATRHQIERCQLSILSAARLNDSPGFPGPEFREDNSVVTTHHASRYRRTGTCSE